jgi:hypothetical protein
MIHDIRKLFGIFIFSAIFFFSGFTQYQTYIIGSKGDTLNAITKDGKKTGKWFIEMPELRGEPGYVEEGIFKDGQKDGYWRMYSANGDLLGIERYKLGGKDGLQQYYNYLGYLEREENWRAYNPDAPYDTIPIYGIGSNEILEFRLVKAETYSVRHGEWRYYEPGTGRVVKIENWNRNKLEEPENKQVAAPDNKPKKYEKPKEVIDWEKKNRGKKGAVRDGTIHL